MALVFIDLLINLLILAVPNKFSDKGNKMEGAE